MKDQNFISGSNEDEVWQQISAQLASNPELLEYMAVIVQQDRKVILDIDIDLGGGFESGYETTTLTAPLQSSTDFRFAIHPQQFTDGIGKFFGMEDVEIGFNEFDEKFIVKTNDPLRVKKIFEDALVRAEFKNLPNFSLGITYHHSVESETEKPYLELLIETGITDAGKLREIYHAFFSVLVLIDSSQPDVV
jgi:hypothetical protein